MNAIDAPTFSEDFDDLQLDLSVWLPHYLPEWSSRAESAAAFQLGDSTLTLSIPVDHGLWLPEIHSPLRVSGVQTGTLSGPVGSMQGQQRPAGAVVHEQQSFFAGWTPQFGRLEMRARMLVSPRSMAAWWMVGLEDEQTNNAEICVFEVFGKSIANGSAEVGMGLHRFADPMIVEDFAAPRVDIDVSEFHDYAVDWSPTSVEFFIDGVSVRRCDQSPQYPMQMMVAVFDFPDEGSASDADFVPRLIVDHLRGYDPV